MKKNNFETKKMIPLTNKKQGSYASQKSVTFARNVEEKYTEIEIIVIIQVHTEVLHITLEIQRNFCGFLH